MPYTNTQYAVDDSSSVDTTYSEHVDNIVYMDPLTDLHLRDFSANCIKEHIDLCYHNRNCVCHSKWNTGPFNCRACTISNDVARVVTRSAMQHNIAFERYKYGKLKRMWRVQATQRRRLQLQADPLDEAVMEEVDIDNFVAPPVRRASDNTPSGFFSSGSSYSGSEGTSSYFDACDTDSLSDLASELSSIVEESIDSDSSAIVKRILNNVLDVLLFMLYDWPKCKTPTDIFISMMRLVRQLVPADSVKDVISWLKRIFNERNLVPQANMADMHKAVHTTCKDLLTSEFMKQLRRFIYATLALMMSLPFAKKVMSKDIDKVLKVCGTMFDQTSLIESILGFVQWFLTSAKAWLVGDKTLKEIFTDQTAAAAFDQRVARLPEMKASVARQDGTVTLIGYYNETLDLKLTAERMLRAVDKWHKGALTKQLSIIVEHFIYAKGLAERDPIRMAPTSILLGGPTAQGKTCLVPIVAYIIQEAYGKKRDSTKHFTLQDGNEFWDDYRPGVEVIIHDDAANTSLEHQKQVVSDTVVMIANNQPRKAVMADLSEKGLYAIAPDGYIVTTNMPLLHATQTSVEPLSILRRMHRHYDIRLIPDERWCENGMLKPGVNPAAFRYDIWRITSYKWRVQEGAPNRNRVEMYDQRVMNFEQFCLEIAETARAQKAHQEQLMQTTRDMESREFCTHGIMRSVCSKEECRPQVEVQFNLTDLVNYTRRIFHPRVDVEQMERMEMHEVQQLARRQTIWNWFVNYYNRGAIWINGIAKDVSAIYGFMAFAQDVVRKPIMAWQWMISLALSATWTTLMLKVFSLALPITYFGMVLAYAIPATYLIRAVPWIVADNNRTVGMIAAEIRARPDFNRKVKIIVVSSAAVGLLLVAYRAWRRRIVTQGSVESRPKPDGVSDCRNVYTQQYIRPIEKNVAVETMSADQVIESFHKHAVFARFHKERDSPSEGCATNLFVIESEHVIVPYHLVKSNEYEWMTLFHGPSTMSNNKRVVSIKGSWQRIGNTDLAVIYSPTIADRKSFVALLTDGIELRNAGCQIFWVESEPNDPHNKDDRTFQCHVGKINATTCDVKISGLESYVGGVYQHVINTRPGLCGSPIVTDKTSGPTLVGFHSAGYNGSKEARFCALTLGAYNEAKAKLHAGDIVQQCQVHERTDHSEALHFQNANWQFRPLQKSQATSSYVAGEFEVLGSSTCPARHLRSNVKISSFSVILEEKYGFKRLHGPPMNIGNYIPWNMWLTNSADPSHVPADMISMAKKDFADKLLSALDADELVQKLSPLDHLSTINGVNGVKGCDPMKKTTSAGIPYTRPKKEFMVPVEPVENILEPHDFMPDVLKAIQDMEDQLKGGFRVYAPHRCNLKDEAIKIGKTKVRVFLGSPLPYLYLMRKYFLPLSILMQQKPFLFEMAVGTNCFGKQWTDIAEYITKFGSDRLIAGDYVKYDQKMEIALTKAAFEILIMLCEKAGYNETQLTVCRGLMTETIAGCYDVRGEWIGLTGGNPSGHALTVIINGLVNLLYMRCVYYALRPDDCCYAFHEVVSLLTYGDDNIAGVSDKIPWYTHTAVSKQLAAWNMQYTMADKEAESVDYITLKDASFLKRSFVLGPDGKYLAPLEEASIAKTLHTYLVSKVMDVKQQHAELLMNANREYWMYGRDVFEVKRDMLMDLGMQADVLHHLKNGRLDTWVEVATWFAEQ